MGWQFCEGEITEDNIPDMHCQPSNTTGQAVLEELCSTSDWKGTG
jgi:hypothetical protein